MTPPPEKGTYYIHPPLSLDSSSLGLVYGSSKGSTTKYITRHLTLQAYCKDRPVHIWNRISSVSLSVRTPKFVIRKYQVHLALRGVYSLRIGQPRLSRETESQGSHREREHGTSFPPFS